MNLSVLITKESQLSCEFAPFVKRIYLEADAVDSARFSEIVCEFHTKSIEVFLALPRIMTPQAKSYLEKCAKSVQNASFDGFLVRSLESLDFIEKVANNAKIVSDYGLYAFNSESRKVLYNYGFSSVTVPLELNGREIKEVGFSNDEMVVYGRAPMMITRNCIHKTLEGCDQKSKERILTDRMKNHLPVENHCAYCLNLIYNGVPTNLLMHRDEIAKLGLSYLRLEFTVEDASECRKIIENFYEVMILNRPAEKPETPYTNGHFTRGVD